MFKLGKKNKNKSTLLSSLTVVKKHPVSSQVLEKRLLMVYE